MSKINTNIKNNLSKIISNLIEDVNMLITCTINIDNLGNIIDLININSFSLKTLLNIVNYFNIIIARGYGTLNISNKTTIDIFIINNFDNSLTTFANIDISNFYDYNESTKNIIPKPLIEIYSSNTSNIEYCNKLNEFLNNLKNILSLLNSI